MRTIHDFTPCRLGFTLIELLVVIAIIAILAAILFPVFAKAREKARQTTCLNNQRQIATSLLMSVQDHDETFPIAANWTQELAATYGVTGKIWDCPSTTMEGTEASPDYFYVGGSFLAAAALGDIKQPDMAPVTGDLATNKAKVPYIQEVNGMIELWRAVKITDTRHNEGGVFSFVDGHVEWKRGASINPIFFLPSLTDADVAKLPPTSLGALCTDVAKNDISGLLEKAGIPIAMSGVAGDATQAVFTNGANSATATVAATTFELGPCASAPSWWKYGVGGTSFNAPTVSAGWDWALFLTGVMTPWGTAKIGGLNRADSTIPIQTLTIVPNVSSPTIKRMALVPCALGGASAATIVSVQVGDVLFHSSSSSFSPSPTAKVSPEAAITYTSPLRSAAGMLLPVIPGKNLIIKYKVDLAGPHGAQACFLAFEN